MLVIVQCSSVTKKIETRAKIKKNIGMSLIKKHRNKLHVGMTGLQSNETRCIRDQCYH